MLFEPAVDGLEAEAPALLVLERLVAAAGGEEQHPGVGRHREHCLQLGVLVRVHLQGDLQHPPPHDDGAHLVHGDVPVLLLQLLHSESIY